MLCLGLFDANIGRILGVFVKDPRILIMVFFVFFGVCQRWVSEDF